MEVVGYRNFHVLGLDSPAELLQHTRCPPNLGEREPQKVTSVILLTGPPYVRGNIITFLKISRGRLHSFISSL